MTANTDTQYAIFELGPFPHFQRSFGLFRPVGRAATIRAVVVVLLGWFPVLILVLADALSGNSSLPDLVKDFGTHSRSLLAAPLFVLCEQPCLRRLNIITTHFIEARMISGEDHRTFRQLIEKCRALMGSTLLEILAIGAAYLAAVCALRYIPLSIMPPWYSLQTATHMMSWAGWWYTVVSIPLLLILVFSWLFRVMLWGWFLFKVSRMNLHLIAAHPDHAAGLRFLNLQLFAFMPLAFTFGVMAAGAVANRITHHGGSTNELKRTAIGLLIFVFVVFVGPLLVFVINLHKQRVNGIYGYGLLVDAVGRKFEHKWIMNYEKVGSDALEAPDFSATTDLYQIADNVYQISLAPFELRTLVSLGVVTLLPLIPVVLTLFPLRVILKEVLSLLFGVG